MIGKRGSGETGLPGWSIANRSSRSNNGFPLYLSVIGAPVLGAPRAADVQSVDYSNNNVTLSYTFPQHGSTSNIRQIRIATCVSDCDDDDNWSSVANLTSHTRSDGGTYVHNGGAAEPYRQYRIWAYNGYDWDHTQFKLPARPIAAKLITEPASGNTFRRGEHIDVEVEFNRNVWVGRQPTLALALGAGSPFTTRLAAYNRGSLSNKIVFRHTVLADDLDLDGFQLSSPAIRTDAGNYLVLAGTQTRITRNLRGWSWLSSYRIDGRNRAPAFPSDTLARSISETVGDATEAAARNIGDPVAATDPDIGDSPTYSLEGADAASFAIDAGSGQLKTKKGVSYDHEAKASYSVTVKVTDGSGSTDTVAVTIAITDKDEPPLAPAAPSVSPTWGTSASLDVAWTAPANAGRPGLTHYDLQYRTGSGGWLDGPQTVSGTSAKIAGLTADTAYEVRVRAANAEGDGAWSVAGTGRTRPTGQPATGAPAIAGTWQAGRTLTASKGDIADANGVPAESAFAWQWLRIDGATESAIAGATGKTYVLTAADIGKKLKVQAAFTDGIGTQESRTSLPYPADGEVTSAVCGVPALGTRRQLWAGLLTAGVVASQPQEHGYAKSVAGRLSDMDFSFGSSRHVVERLTTQRTGSASQPVALRLVLDRALTTDQKAALMLHICDRPAIALSRSSPGSSLTEFRFPGYDSFWFDGYEATARLSLPANRPATGSPGLSAPSEFVGETFTASKGDIADADGLPAESAFAWQWLRVDGTAETEISGATGKTYAATVADFGKRLRVRATFTDELGSSESRKSASTGAIGSRLPVVTIAAGTSPVTEGTAATFTLSRTGASAQALTVRVNVSESGGDMVAAAAEGAKTTTFAAGAATAALSVATVDDERDEENSVVTASVLADSGNPAGYLPGARDSASVTVNDDEADSTNALRIVRLGNEPNLCSGVNDRPTERVEGTICLGVLFNGINPAGFAQSDLRITNGAVDNFRFGFNTSVQRITVNVTGTPGSDLVFRIPRGSLNAGNAEAVWRATITGRSTGPQFSIAETVGEDAEAAPRTVGTVTAIGASDNGYSIVTGDTLDGTMFSYDADTRVVSTVKGVRYDHEADSRREFNLRAEDGTGAVSTVRVVINVTDVDEPPVAPDAPTLAQTPDSETGIDASWTAPANAGRPRIRNYDIQYRGGGSGDWIAGPSGLTATRATIANLTRNRLYQVRVRASNAEGTGSWSVPAQFKPANALPTAANKTAAVNEDATWTAGVADFGFSDTDSGDSLASVKITALPASGKGALELDGTAIAGADLPQTVAAADLSKLQYAPPANANGSAYATLSFKVNDGTADSAASYVLTFNVTAVNDAATGLPTISGTARVGQTLTASVSAIADAADGLTRAANGEAGYAFAYQWLRVVNGSDTLITGATAKTYLLTTADQDRKLKVRVSFKDDDGHAETLTSAETGTVGANAAPTGANKTVTINEDATWTAGTADFGFSDTDSGDSLASVKITSLPASGKGELKLDGTAIAATALPKAVSKAELDAGKLTWAPPANANGSAYASFSFKVNDGTADSAAAYTLTFDVTAVNDAATGLPAISGTARVGQTLTASVAAIADAADGLTRAAAGEAGYAFAYQWLRVAGGSDTLIAGATSKTYRLAAADENRRLKVRVSFKDDDGHAETLTSAETGTVGANAAPTAANKTATINEDATWTAGTADFGFSDTDSGDTLSSVKVTALPASGKGALELDGAAIAATALPKTVTAAEIAAGKLTYVPPANANGNAYATFSFKVSDGTADSAAAYTVTFDVAAVNDAATGLPAISGTARVGQTLTASTAAIADAADGLTRAAAGEAGYAFAYQWLRVVNGSDTVITGATSMAYRLAAADQDRRLKVRVSFKDDDGHAEALTSAETGTVGANALPTSANKTVAINEDATWTAKAADFSFSDTDTGDTLASVKITALPASGKGALELDGAAIASTALPKTVTKAELDAGKLAWAPPANANGSAYATFSFKVNDGTADSAAAYALTFNVTAVNDAATGLPTISGTARVGQTLTASVSAIADAADGLTRATAGEAGYAFAYQWLRVAGGSDTLITGATAKTYRLADADQDRKLKVRISFKDDDGHAETLTSADTGTVGANALPTSANKTVAINEDATWTAKAADFSFSDTDTGDTLASVKITALPAAGKGALELDGTAIAATALPKTVTAAELGKLTWAPPANANGDDYATLSFKVNDGTADSAAAYTVTFDVAAVNDAATGRPTISGTARVGQTLTASVAAIADAADGLTRAANGETGYAFAYQWLRVVNGSDTVITGATSMAYRLATADENRKLKVRVSFKDDDGHAETLTSADTGTVGANAAPAGANKTVAINEDATWTAGAADFGFSDTDSGDALASVKITSLPASGKGELKLDGTAIAGADLPKTVTAAEIAAGKLTWAPPANANGSAYATLSFKVNDGTADSASAYTVTFNVTAVNDAATGLPAISGTARVGQTLTASVAAIADAADGLTRAANGEAGYAFAYQWLRVVNGSDTLITGATSKTYRLAAADENRRLKVRVSFKDDDGHAETLTSADTGTVGANAAPTGANKTVTINEDATWTAGAADFGFSDTDTGDALAAVKITALPASGKGALELDGTAIVGADLPKTVTAADLGKLTWAPPANAKGSAYATLSFKVNDGTADSASAYTVTFNVAAVNDAATGLPAISGTARVGQTLTASVSAIADAADGLTKAANGEAGYAFAYQWLRVVNGSDTVITGATAKTYRLAAADENRKLKVRVSFKDDDGHAEALTSAETGTVGANAAPTAANKTVTINEDATWTAKAADFSFSDTDTGDTLASVKITALPASGKGALELDGTAIAATALPKTVTAAELGAGKLTYAPPANANGSAYATLSFKVNDGTADSASAYTVTFDVAAVNDAATGLPAISGTARVGQTLTASVSAIADAADGLTRAANGEAGYAFAYQWLRVVNGSDTVIAGATSKTYRLATADQDRKLKVRVSFKDDDGHAETLTSAETGTVGANAAPTAANKTVTINEDATWTAGTADFGFSDTDSGDALAAVKITALPASGKGELKLDGTMIAGTALPKAVSKAELDAGKLTYAPPVNANGDDYATFSFKVNDGTADSAAAYTLTFDVAAVNDAATGLPAISGTARVGQTLTASVAAIADAADGLTKAANGEAGYAFAYQWLRVVNGSDTVIAGATSKTYRLASADENRRLKVRVSFKDDDGHAETLASNAYPASDDQVDANAAPTGASKTVAVNEDAAWTAGVADFGFSDTDSGDALASVKVTALPAAGKGELKLDGTAIAGADLPKTVTAADLGKLTWAPPANANGSTYATFSFKVNDGTADSAAAYTVTFDVAAVNDAATGLPTISGTARVGQTLTASVAAIADAADGLTRAANGESGYAFAYQWLRVVNGSDTVIAGATSKTYRLAPADENRKLKVRVSFKDDDGHAETLTSADTGTVGANAAPTGANKTVTVNEDATWTAGVADFGFSDTDSGDALAAVKITALPASGKGALELDGTAIVGADLPKTVTAADLGKLTWAPPANANGSAYATFSFKVNDGTADSAAAYTVTFDVAAVNDAATGLPSISGTARVGQTLTASVSAIADATDGLTRAANGESGYAFAYQWLRVVNGSDTVITGATSKTYRLTTADENRRLKVRVSFKDDDGHAETLTSAETGTVGANAAPTAANKTVTINEDATWTAGTTDFGFSDTDTGDALAAVKITALPASGKGALELDGTAIAATALPKTVTKPELDAGKLTWAPPANANGDDYATLSFKVNDGTADSAAAYTVTFDVAAVNDAATGLPSISGTARVGQALTASVSAIADAADGLTRAANGESGYAFAYQWLRVVNGSDTVITGATAKTYRLTTADENRRLKVRVSFKDDDGHAETLTSNAYPASDDQVDANAAPTAANKTVTINEDATWTAGAADFGFSDTDTGDALAAVKITALPASGKGALELDGTAIVGADLPKTVTAADLGKLTWAPPANANGSAYATFSFKVNDGTADSASAYTVTFDVAAVNDAATGLPAISGTARVGQTLTASVAAIADAADGLTRAAAGEAGYAFAYQWLRVVNGRDTLIAGATSKNYRLATADRDRKLKVRVSFKDDDGHAETLASNAYPASDGQVDANAAPTGANKTVTVNEDATWTAGVADFGFSDTDSGDALAAVKITALPASGKGALELDGTAIVGADLPKTVTAADLGKLTWAPPANANGSAYATLSFKVNDGTADSAAAYTLTFNVTAVNDASTGLPSISGTARVGQTLAASVAGIADAADGLTRAANGEAGYAFAYQWLRVAGGSDTVITGATSKTHRLATADRDRKLKVRVSFKDDDGHGETLTSAETGTVGANAAPTAANKTVTINEDATWTAKAADFSFSDTDTGDTLASVKITALPASGKGALELDGTAIAATALPKTVTAAELGAGKLTYASPANANGSAYATLSFKVNDGTADSAAAYTLTFDVAAVNDAATGLPSISGTARVGQALTASVAAIADAADGLTRAANGEAGYAFAYQWLRVVNGSDTVIAGATSMAYRLAAADEDRKLKVRVSFKDDDGHAEALTSNAYPASDGQVDANAAPTGANKTVTVNEDATWTAGAADFGFSDADTGDTLASVKITALPASGKGELKLDGTAIAGADLPKTVTAADLGKLAWAPPANANGSAYATLSFKVNDGTADSASAYTVTFDVAAVNDAATGLPAISGAARVGQTLTASVSAIADAADGLTRAANGEAGYAFTYQWLRVVNGSDTVITGATSKTYRLATADRDRKLKVRVSFKDDDGHAETLTSNAYPASDDQVDANAAPTGASKTVAVNEDAAWTAGTADFGFSDTDSGDALAAVKITALPASGKGEIKLDGAAIAATALPKTVTAAELGAGKLTWAPPANANGSTYATFSFKVNDGTADSASAYTVTFNVAAVNDAATGLPAISGTARVGQTLTASVAAIADAADGLTRAANGEAGYAFAYQWLRVVNGSDTVIAGATAKTHRLATADENRKLKVRVSFKDDDGHAETLTSNAYPASDDQVDANAAPTGANKTVTVNEDATWTAGTADFGFSDTDTGDALAAVKITALPASGKGELKLDGTAIASTALPRTVSKADLDAGKLQYAPPANANGSAYATFSFKVNDGTADSAAAYTVTFDVAAVNDAATGLPAISGTARVGQTLTASVAAIADAADGLTRAANGDTGYAFAYQWLRVVNGSDTVIAGATAKTYRLAAADENRKLKVRVSFKDDDGHAETLASNAYPASDGQVDANAAPTAASKTVAVNEDAAWTAKAADFGFSDTDTGDTLASVKITALPAAGKGALELDGTAIASTALPRTVTAAEIAAGKLTWAPPANDNGSAYATFSFKVNDGTADSAAAYTVTFDVAAVNDAATGLPTISGTARVGQTLAASTAGIADAADGLTRAANGDTGYAFAYQWLRVVNGSDTVIAGATSKTHRLATADENRKLKVRVSFKDDDGHAETLTSNAYPASDGQVDANAAPTGASKTVAINEDAAWTAGATDFSFSDTDSGDALASVKVTALPAAGKGALELDGTAIAGADLPKTVTAADLGKLTWAPPANANGSAYATFSFKVNDGTADSAAAYTVTFDVAAVNDAATGLPSISGTARVGQTLTASVSAIADAADGLTRAANGDTGYAFAYQWLRVVNGSDTVIAGATSKTYRLATADENRRLKVRVSFKDDDGHAETLASNAYPASDDQVDANAAPTGASKTVAINEDATWTAGAADFGFSDTDTGDALVSVKITALPATGKGELKLDGTAIAATALPKTVTAAELGAGKLQYAPPANANGSAYATLSFKVNDGTADSAASYVLTFNVTAVNDAATGLPTISGTARVGQTLTASVAAIADAADGLTRAANGESGYAFAYQWLRVVNGSDTLITGATSKTYLLTTADENRKLKVRVSFKDDDGHAETLISNDTGTVGANENTTGDGTLRLVDGETPNEGRIEMFYDSQWGSICDDFFTENDGDLTCKLLGYDGAAREMDDSFNGYVFKLHHFGPGTGPFWLDDLKCKGDETSLLQCPRRGNEIGEHNCKHVISRAPYTEDAGVRCAMTPRLVDIELGAPSGSDARFHAGDTVELTLVWNMAVDIGIMPAYQSMDSAIPPKVWLDLSSSSSGESVRVSPGYVRGTGTARLVFAITLSPADGESKWKTPQQLNWHTLDTLSVPSNSLTLRRTGMLRGADGGRTADLTHAEHSWNLDNVSEQQRAAPAVVGVPQVTGPGSDGAYATGERIEARVVFDAPVAVDVSGGTPSLGIALNGVRREAPYASGSGSTTLVFSHELAAADDGAGAAAAIANGIALNGGTIGTSGGLAAALDFGSAPGISGVDVVPAGGGGQGWGEGDSIEVGVDFAEPVEVDTAGGTPTIGISLSGTAHRSASYARGSATSRLIFSYTLVKADGAVSDALVRPNTLALNGGTIRSTAGLDAVLTHVGGGSVIRQELAEPALSVADSEASEGGTMSFRVTLAPAASEAVSVSYATVDGTAVAGADYTASSGTLSFAAGDTEKLVEVPTTTDALVEGTETFTLRLSDAVGASVEDGEATGTVTDAVSETAPTATFSNVPARHDGESALTLELTFSGEPGPGVSSYTAVRDSLLDVTGGDIENASRKTQGSNAGWVLTVRPAGAGAVTLTLPVRACGGANAVCIGGEPLATAVTASIQGPSFTGSFDGAPSEHDGSAFTVNFRIGAEPDGLSYVTVRDSMFNVAGGSIGQARRLTRGSDRGWELTVAPDGFGPVTLALEPTTDCHGTPGVCDAAGRMLAGPLSLTVEGPPTLSVADASVEEAEGAALDFRVTLSRALGEAVTVAYATSDGTAAAGADYTAQSGTLTFAAGETTKTVPVAVLDDVHDDDGETVAFTLSNPSPARVKLADAEATGTINNTDLMPQAWTARFGRAVAGQVLDAVEGRVRAARAPGVEVSFAGRRIHWPPGAGRGPGPVTSPGTAPGDAWALSAGPAAGGGGTLAMRDGDSWAKPGPAPASGPASGPADPAGWLRGPAGRNAGLRPRAAGARDLLLGSSFNATVQAGGPDSGGGTVSVWGRGAVTNFNGRDGELAVEGEVASAMLGADWGRGRTLAGLIVGHSAGGGGYSAPAGGGAVSSTLTGIYPWGRHAVSERIEAWGAAGYGIGALTLAPDGQDATRADLDLWMAAGGLRGTIVQGGAGGLALAAKADALIVETSTAEVPGELAASEATVTRLRLGLEASRPFALANGAALTPSIEVAVRQDGGDAEAGFGADIGGAIAWTDPKRGLNAEIRGRGLLTRESKGFRERGFSGSLSWSPGEGGLGPSLSLTQSIGGASSGGADALLQRVTMEGLAANHGGAGRGLMARRMEARFGYGFPAFDGGFTFTPAAGAGLSDTGRDYSLGWRLVRAGRGGGRPGASLELSFEATRRESAANGKEPPEHGAELRLTSRF